MRYLFLSFRKLITFNGGLISINTQYILVSSFVVNSKKEGKSLKGTVANQTRYFVNEK